MSTGLDDCFDDLSRRYKTALAAYQGVVERNMALSKSGLGLPIDHLRQEQASLEALQLARRTMLRALRTS